MQKVNEADLEFRGGDSGVKYLMRGPNIDWGIILLKPGERLNPHYHEQVEETFYFAQGAGTIIVNGVTYRAVQGDAYRLEPLERHEVVNDTDAPTKLVFIKHLYLPQDKVTCE